MQTGLARLAGISLASSGALRSAGIKFVRVNAYKPG